jgi:hypothetical protein
MNGCVILSIGLRPQSLVLDEEENPNIDSNIHQGSLEINALRMAEDPATYDSPLKGLEHQRIVLLI